MFFENPGTRIWNGLDLEKLNVDEAYFNVTSINRGALKLYSLVANCYNCPYVFNIDVKSNSSQVISVSTRYESVWRIYSSELNEFTKSITNNRSLVCEVSPSNLGEFGVYDLLINEKECHFVVKKNPVNIYLSLQFILLGAIVLYVVAVFGYKKIVSLKKTNEEDPNKTSVEDYEATVSNNVNSESQSKKRIKSIDTFRGIALCLMVLINDGGGGYWFLQHEAWNGITLADLPFPWFIWIMGICIGVSQKSQIKSKIGKSELVVNALRRGCILFLLGLSLNTLGVGPVQLYKLRIPGVLQRIGVSYTLVTLIAISFPFKHYKINVPWLIKDISILWPQWIVHLFILGIYYFIIFYLPVPGCPTGYLGAGGIQDDRSNENCTGGVTGYIDKLILGENHLYQNSKAERPYYTTIFDPENIFGCLPATFQVFLGLQAGCILKYNSKPKDKLYKLLIWAILSAFVGYSIHFSSLIPINKHLWSLSYVLVTTGYGFGLLMALYFVIDHLEEWDGSPFIYPGMNSILVYVGHELCYNLFPWHWELGTMNTHFIRLIENMWGVFLWILISAWLYRKQIFLTV